MSSVIYTAARIHGTRTTTRVKVGHQRHCQPNLPRRRLTCGRTGVPESVVCREERYARMARIPDPGFALRTAVAAAEPILRRDRAALADARHRRDLRHLQRDLRRAHRAVPVRQAG